MTKREAQILKDWAEELVTDAGSYRMQEWLRSELKKLKEQLLATKKKD